MTFLRAVLVLLMVTVAVSGCGKKKEQEALFRESGKGAEAPVKNVPRDLQVSQQAFTELARTTTPAVVNISAETRRRAPQPFFEFSPFFDDFFSDMERPRMQRERSVGSGFIINGDGLIVTNDHVVNGASRIEVKLSNDNVYPARVVGRDPKTDIALIRISPRETLPVAVLGDSDTLQVGQWAVAIGNPFGLDRTFTVGVISATGRSGMGIETYEDFIQTDASINPGNSGGPLLNINGEVIGINTAIVASGQGIGFAIPINMAKGVITQLAAKGSVNRGWLGVSIQPVTDELARSFGLKSTKGALVADIMADSPAEAAGFRQGDVITSFAGTPVKDYRHLQRLVAEAPANKPLEAVVIREGREMRLSVTLVPTDSPQALNAAPRHADTDWLGMDVAELPLRLQQRGLSGVLVANLDPGGMAADAGIEKGDILVAINRTAVADVAAYRRALQGAERAGSLTILVRRGGASIYFALRPGGRR